MEEEHLRQTIKDWVFDYLSKPNTTTGLVLCPFAKAAWLDNKVNIVFQKGEFLQEVVDQAYAFDDTYDVVICVQIKPEQEYNSLDMACMALNKMLSKEKRDVWLLSFQTDFAMVFVQRLTDLDDASQKLEKMGYYDCYSSHDYNRLVRERRKRRLEYAGK